MTAASFDHLRVARAPGYTHVFDPNTGFSARWGDTKEEDPTWSPLGPEIMDIEITTSCSGPSGAPCSFCYKSNTPKGENMTYETFVKLFSKLPKNLTQIAFGADATLTSNPDVWKIFEHCRSNGVVPNVTVANVDKTTAEKLASLCGAVAVSRYADENLCYDSVRRLLDAGLKQVNIHQLLSEETYTQAVKTIWDVKRDERLGGLKAVVFLSLKRKGRGENLNQLSFDKFSDVCHVAMEAGIQFGFDSCSANKFLKWAKGRNDLNQKAVQETIEPCESTCFSLYVDVKGRAFPCSFSEGVPGWHNGIDLVDESVAPEFMDAWNGARMSEFRKRLHGNLDDNGVRACPLYEV